MPPLYIHQFLHYTFRYTTASCQHRRRNKGIRFSLVTKGPYVNRIFIKRGRFDSITQFGTCMCSKGETNLSWTCLVSRLLSFEHTLVLLFFSVLWQKLLHQQKNTKKENDYTKKPSKFSIKQRLQTNLGRSVGVILVPNTVVVHRFLGLIFPLSAKAVQPKGHTFKNV